MQFGELIHHQRQIQRLPGVFVHRMNQTRGCGPGLLCTGLPGGRQNTLLADQFGNKRVYGALGNLIKGQIG